MVILVLRAGYLRVTHPFATEHKCSVRLACIRRTASVNPEPGSNSPLKMYCLSFSSYNFLFFKKIGCLFLIIIQFSKTKYLFVFFRHSFILSFTNALVNLFGKYFLNRWWRGADSNCRTLREQIYSLPRLATSLPLR